MFERSKYFSATSLITRSDLINAENLYNTREMFNFLKSFLKSSYCRFLNLTCIDKVNLVRNTFELLQSWVKRFKLSPVVSSRVFNSIFSRYWILPVTFSVVSCQIKVNWNISKWDDIKVRINVDILSPCLEIFKRPLNLLWSFQRFTMLISSREGKHETKIILVSFIISCHLFSCFS